MKSTRIPNNIYANGSKENKENIRMNGKPAAFATPSEDDFDDDDDDLLLQASQMAEEKLGLGKNDVKGEKEGKEGKEGKDKNQLLGENAILRSEVQRLGKEKEQINQSKIAESKAIDARYRREIETLKSRLEFKEKDIQDLRSKVQSSSSSGIHEGKRPRLAGASNSRQPATVNGSRTDRYLLNNFASPRAALASFQSCPEEVEGYSSKCLVGVSPIGRVRPVAVPGQAVMEEVEGLIERVRGCKGGPPERVALYNTLRSTLQYNRYPQAGVLSERLVPQLRGAGKEEHRSITSLLLAANFNLFTMCGRRCAITDLVGQVHAEAVQLILGSLSRPAGMSSCTCHDKLLYYLCNAIELAVETENYLASDTSHITDLSLVSQCMSALARMAPLFPSLDASIVSQQRYLGSLELVAKDPSLPASESDLLDFLRSAQDSLIRQSSSA